VTGELAGLAEKAAAEAAAVLRNGRRALPMAISEVSPPTFSGRSS
jgi:hypothetical protein